MFDGPVLGARVDLGGQLDRAVAAGVESLRIAVDWAALAPSARATPDFSSLDRIVAAAARRRLSLLPVVERAPAWDASVPGNPASPPRSAAPYAQFLAVLARRYGPGGSFWSANPGIPRVPIRMWQIWNEPNFVSYWSVQPFARSYVKLLAASRAALKAVDPGAKIVLSGFADFSWQYLAQVYAVPGARALFDVVAIHPYTAQPAGVIEILRRTRAVMDRNGDTAKPILATEITWPSSQGKTPPQFGVSTTESQQAQRLGQVLPLLDANRARLGLMGFYWYTWMGDESPGIKRYAFNYAGLMRYIDGAVSAKPALAVFKRLALSIEGCRSKTSAISCAS